MCSARDHVHSKRRRDDAISTCIARMAANLVLRPDVRFGSTADMCPANRQHVRFTTESGHSELSRSNHQVMSASPPKADMCSAPSHVRFGPKADIAPSEARPLQPILDCAACDQ
jgi:hypothetical protein